MEEVELLHELEPTVERLYHRHLATAKVVVSPRAGAVESRP